MYSGPSVYIGHRHADKLSIQGGLLGKCVDTLKTERKSMLSESSLTTKLVTQRMTEAEQKDLRQYSEEFYENLRI